MMHLHAWRPCQLQYVADAFSTQFETAVTPQELAAEDLACMLNETASSTASGPLPDADAQLRACFVSYARAQVTPYRDGWAFTVRAVATAFAENSLAELESYEKTLELVFPLAVEAPPGAQFSPECWLSTENIQCSCTGGTLEVTVTARAREPSSAAAHIQGIGSVELGEPLTTPDPEIALRIYYAQAGERVVRHCQTVPCVTGTDPDGKWAGSRNAGPAAGDAFSGAGRINRRRTLPFQAAFSFCAEKKVKKPFLLCVRESIIKSGV